MGRFGDFGGWAPYVPVAEKRRKAKREAATLGKKGHACQPVNLDGRVIARTFWGKAWCSNLERYSDFSNRLPRGRSYVRNGAVVDLRIEKGKVAALVAGSSLYRVDIEIRSLGSAPWKHILEQCAGKIASLVELLQGRLSHAVMEVVTRPATGLFPAPRQIGFNCTCPDGASMCKHVAAALYGVGNRLDSQPELLFRLRHVDPQDLILRAGSLASMETPVPLDGERRLETSDLSGLFGIDLDEGPRHGGRSRQENLANAAEAAVKPIKKGRRKRSSRTTAVAGKRRRSG